MTCGIAFCPILSELYSKLISRSMLGRFWAMIAICSRSAVESERVGRLRKLFMNLNSSALRASSAGDVVRLFVVLAIFSALIISRIKTVRADCHDERRAPYKQTSPPVFNPWPILRGRFRGRERQHRKDRRRSYPPAMLPGAAGRIAPW